MTNQEELQEGNLLPLAEDFYTIQGEGYHSGKAAYFIRLGGCDVGCAWCDAKFTWNPKMYAPTPISEIVERATDNPAKAIVITGGEPLMYPLGPITKMLHQKGVEIFIETSGSHPFSGDIDWVCLSPKKQMPPLEGIYKKANELKVIIQTHEDFEWAEKCAAKVGKDCLLYLQPEWKQHQTMMHHITEYVKANPKWLISIQSHKYMNIP
ncbi:MAG: 7-carboxy-7-deazaguanine synthase QueE [Rikenellaceae bacterium]